jgi:A/G-specific adenine glycosylase
MHARHRFLHSPPFLKLNVMNDPVATFTPPERTRLRRRVQSWFQVNRRDLPWRRTRNPYAIWVSEVMLQQTQIATVIPFYLRFLERFPTVAALAGASEQDVLRHWEGLGYYRRARLLHRAARVIVAEHAGAFPADLAAASALPGLGRYTVGAILSQAFDHRLPVVDTNIARVLTRLGAWQGELENRDTQRWLWLTAEAVLPRQGAGDFNQALMELGQTVCLPKRPSCLLCPLRDLCQGWAKGLAERLPKRAGKLQTIDVNELAVIVQHRGRVLLAQRRPDAARWANMWEFPTATFDTTAESRKQAMAFVRRLTGVGIKQVAHLGVHRHGVTRHRITLHAVVARYSRGTLHRKHYQDLQWLWPHDLADYPLSVPQRRLARLWLESREPVRQ